MRRAEVYKLGPTWLIAQKDGKFWCVDASDGHRLYGERFHTHQQALDAALAWVGLTEKNTLKETNR